MDIISWEFVSLIILVFAVVMILAGIFSAYFGKGKNRAYGIIMVVEPLPKTLLNFFAHFGARGVA